MQVRNEGQSQLAAGSGYLLIIGDFKSNGLITTASVAAFRLIHPAETATILRMSRKTDSRHPVHTVMPLHTDTRCESEV